MPPSHEEILVEEALRLLVREFPDSGEQDRKSALFHSIRVGTELWKNGHPIETVLGGFLHDVLEDTAITRRRLSSLFGPKVAGIVAANTVNPKLAKNDRSPDSVRRCVRHSGFAEAVKAADVLDNFLHYSRAGDGPETERARGLAKLLVGLSRKKWGYDAHENLLPAAE